MRYRLILSYMEEHVDKMSLELWLIAQLMSICGLIQPLLDLVLYRCSIHDEDIAPLVRLAKNMIFW